VHNVSSLIVGLFCQGQPSMHQLRYYFAIDGDFVPLETLGIRYWWCFGTAEEAVTRHGNETKTLCRIDETYLSPQNP